MNFMDALDADHGGKARVVIDLAHSQTRLEDGRIVGVELWIRLLLGLPEIVGNTLVYPVEMSGVGTFDRRLHGDASDEEIGILVLKRALDTAWRGASSLLDAKPTTPVEISGLNLAKSGRITSILQNLAN